MSKHCLDEEKLIKSCCVYFLKTARITLMIAPTTTTQPATITMIGGMPGTSRGPLIIPDPTASATITPTTHAKIPTIVLSAMLPPYFFFLRVVKWKNAIANANEIMSVMRYVSKRVVVYPKYSVMEFRLETLSGFRLQRVHLYIGGMIFGVILHGMIGMIIEVTRVAAEINAEYIIFFLNIMFLLRFLCL